MRQVWLNNWISKSSPLEVLRLRGEEEEEEEALNKGEGEDDNLLAVYGK